MFPGQGNQYHNMGAQLYAENPHFRQTVDECCDFLLKKFDLDLRAFIFAEADTTLAKQALEKTYITQPAIFVISYAMARLLIHRGIKPEAMIGHSVGEYVAACLAGIMSLEDALTLVAQRGALVQKLPGGSMLAVLQNEDKILSHLFPGVEVAAVNNPGLCVAAGSDENIEKLEANLSKSGFFCKRLSTSHAFHSAMMEPCLPAFASLFDTVSLSSPSIPIISTVTGNFLTESEATDPDYWVQHVRRTVRFTDAVVTCMDMKTAVFLEVGPGQSLESAVKRHLNKDSKHAAVRTMTTETESIDDNEFLASAIGNVWLAGGEIDWETYYNGQNRRRISLPCYPYERKPYTIDFSKINTTKVQKTNTRYSDIRDWYSLPVWKRTPGIDYLVNNVPTGQTWLMLHDELGLGREIAKTLRDMKQEVYEVFPGTTYRRIAANRFQIDIGNKESYEWLVRDLIDTDVDIQNIIHLINYTPKRNHDLPLEELEQVENATFFSPLYLQQAFYAANKLKDLQFSIVANGVFNVIGEHVYAPEKALAIGPCRVMIQEFPTTRARFIDADIQRNERQLHLLARNIILESQQKTYETVVAYRNGHRWAEGYTKFPFEASEKVSYKDNGIYFITGGLGGIGIVTAKAIAGKVKATFILTYQSAFPERVEWENWLENNPGISFTREKIEGIRELEAMGATVS